MTQRVLADDLPHSVKARFELALGLCTIGHSVLYLCKQDREAYYLRSAMEMGWAETRSKSIARIEGATVFFSHTGACISIVSEHDVLNRNVVRKYDWLVVNSDYVARDSLLKLLFDNYERVLP